MIRVYIFSSKKAITKKLGDGKKSSGIKFDVHPVKDIEKAKKAVPGSLLYLDLSSVSKPAEAKKWMTALKKLEDYHIGIIDPEGKIDDPATLFHDEFSDYIGPKLFKKGVPASRFKTVSEFYDFGPEEEDEIDNTDLEEFSMSWKEVTSGKKYSFIFLFAEVDLTDEWRRKSGKQHLNDILKYFYAHIEKWFGAYEAKLWLSTETGGLFLIPFNGKNCPITETLIRHNMNKLVASADEFPFDTYISMRFILHIGNTLYEKKGNTGSIISSDINFLFHAMHNHVPADRTCITDRVLACLCPEMKPLITGSSVFEGRNLHMLKQAKFQ